MKTSARQAQGNERYRKPTGIERRLERTAYLFILPAAVLLIVFCVLPLIASFYVSVQQMGVDLQGAKFVGLKNFQKAIADRRFLQSIGITLRYTGVEVPLQMVIGVVLSALLSKNTPLNKLFRSIYFLPVITSAVTVGVTWQLVLHSNIGIFTYWLKCMGFRDVNLLNNTSTALYVVVFVAIWKTFGISTIILVSAIQNIPESLFEASSIDGAGKVRQFFHVTLPGIMPSFWFPLMTRIIGSLQMFDIVYTMTGGGPSKSTTTMVVYIYDTAFNSLNKMGYATAMSELLFAGIMLITVIMYYVMDKTSE
ncbi:MAG: sugar ABC transporter permease [Clostridia bacterium]|nr:sugar ABC transporter permease [Clostridia bacterium]